LPFFASFLTLSLFMGIMAVGAARGLRVYGPGGGVGDSRVARAALWLAMGLF
jgi:hypothetical protein